MEKILIFHLILITFPVFVLAEGEPKSSGWNNLYIIPIYVGFFTLAVLLSIIIRRLRRGTLGTNDGQLPVRAPGMGAEEIASLPSMRFSEIKLHKVAEQGQLECSVCLTEFKDDEVLRLLPDCLHVFHPDCITPWLRTHVTCPVCRASLEHRQESSVSTSTVLEGILSSDMYDHHHDGHDEDGHHDNDHVLTVEIEGSVSQHVDLDGTRGERRFGKCYSTGNLAVRFVGEGRGRNGSDRRSNVGEIDEKSRK